MTISSSFRPKIGNEGQVTCHSYKQVLVTVMEGHKNFGGAKSVFWLAKGDFSMPKAACVAIVNRARIEAALFRCCLVVEVQLFSQQKSN